MAINKYRLVKPTSDGTSDTIYLETSSDVVMRPSGETVENALAGLKTAVDTVGLPAGGTTGQVPSKKSNADHDVQWIDLPTPPEVASSATKLATARTIQTNLASTTAVGFDGTKNITPGITGTLPVKNGGTGVTSIDSLKSTLGISVSTVAAPAKPASGYLNAATGTDFTWANKRWTIVHRESTYMVIALAYYEEDFSGTPRTFDYVSGDIYRKCIEFSNRHGLFGCDYIINIGGVPCFIPTNVDITSYSFYISGVTDTNWYGSEYDKNDPFLNARFRTSSGSTYHDWWVNYSRLPTNGVSFASNLTLWAVMDSAGVRVNANALNPHGFRPHVMIKL